MESLTCEGWSQRRFERVRSKQAQSSCRSQELKIGSAFHSFINSTLCLIQIGMETRSIKLPNAVGEAEVVDAIDELNRRNDVNGILLQVHSVYHCIRP